MGVPTAEANAQGLRCTKQVISMLRDQYVDENSLKEEKEIIIAETKCLLDKCFELAMEYCTWYCTRIPGRRTGYPLCSFPL